MRRSSHLFNLVNVHDVVTLVHMLKNGQFKRITELLTLGSTERVQTVWQRTSSPTKNWNEIPAVKERWNRFISGNPQVGHMEYIAQKYFPEASDLHALSLGCGTGGVELAWAKTGAFECIDAYDLSAPRINVAIKQAHAEGLEHVLNFQIGDVRTLTLPEAAYDVVILEHALHHFSPLAAILEKVDICLKPHGFLIVNEFVGPSRFQWTDRQLAAVNGVLALLPTRYRTLPDGSLKKPVYRPSLLRMLLVDPSEAVESARIMPSLRKLFSIIELKPWGGTLLSLLFSEIGQNFPQADAASDAILQWCFEAEDLLLAETPSDFALVVCKKRTDAR